MERGEKGQEGRTGQGEGKGGKDRAGRRKRGEGGQGRGSGVSRILTFFSDFGACMGIHVGWAVEYNGVWDFGLRWPKTLHGHNNGQGGKSF